MTYADRAFVPHLLGIAAYVYADTFSHYGFLGVSSRGSRVDNDSFLFQEEVEGADGATTKLSFEMRDYVTRKAASFFGTRGAISRAGSPKKRPGRWDMPPSPPCLTGSISSGVSTTSARTRSPGARATTPSPFWRVAGLCTAYSGSSPACGPTLTPETAGISKPSPPARRRFC